MAFDTGISFVDNPLVQAIGSHLGMDGLFASKAASPAPAAATPPPPPKAPPVNEVSKVRESKAVRQSYPRAAGGRGLGTGGGGQGGVGMNLPGVMSPDTLMHPAVQQLLGQYGVSPDQLSDTVKNANPNLFVTNPSAFEKHPVMAGLLERGLEGLAFTKGGDTIGENLSNVAQGVLNSQAARADKYNNQLMMPFQQASAVAGLKGEAARQQFEAAQAQRDQALVKHYADMDDTRQFIAEQNGQWRQQQEANRAMANHIKLLSDKRFSSLTPDQEAAFNGEIAQAGGLGKISDETFEKYAQMGSDNLFKAQEAGKNKRAEISAGAHITGAKISAASRPGSNHEYDDAKTKYNAAQKALHDFDANVARTNGFGMTDENGKVMNRQGRAAYRQRLMDTIKSAGDVMDSAAKNQGLTVPGSGMTNTPPPGARVRDYTQLGK